MLKRCPALRLFLPNAVSGRPSRGGWCSYVQPCTSFLGFVGTSRNAFETLHLWEVAAPPSRHMTLHDSASTLGWLEASPKYFRVGCRGSSAVLGSWPRFSSPVQWRPSPPNRRHRAQRHGDNARIFLASCGVCVLCEVCGVSRVSGCMEFGFAGVEFSVRNQRCSSR